MAGYLGKETIFTWLGHSTFLIETVSGSRVIIDPWLEGNPACPKEFHRLSDVDLILVTHGHADHIGDLISLALRTEAQVVCNYEIGQWLETKGVKNVVPMNKGGTVEAAGLQITMTHASHSSGVMEGDRMIYGGEPAGFVIETENQFCFYCAGDTDVFGDMALIGEIYSPELAILPIGDRFTMGPRGAAKAAHLLGVKVVIPCHHSTFDLLTGTPQAFEDALGDLPVTVATMKPGQVLE